MAGVYIAERFCFDEEVQLTVLKTSVFFHGDGFTVYDPDTKILFRVDTYGSDVKDQDELVLMDALGKILLTLRKKRPSLHHRWEGFVGERKEGQKPIFSVKRSSIVGRSNVAVDIHRSSGTGEEYQIEGSFHKRRCSIYAFPTREIVGEVKRKIDTTTNMVLGKDVFILRVMPRFDAAFAVGLVLILDQIYDDDDVSIDDENDTLHRKHRLISTIKIE